MFHPEGKIEKFEGQECLNFMDALGNMEDDKNPEQQESPEIMLKGNERFMPPPKRQDDDRPDPEQMRKPQPLEDTGNDDTPSTGMTFKTNTALINEMKQTR